VIIRVLNANGEIIGDPVEVGVMPQSTTQIVRIAERAGIYSDLDIFSLYIYTNGHDVSASASIVDNATGDPVHVESVGQGGSTFWLPGVARLAGANDSDWRSDVTFFNNTTEELSTMVEYFSPENSQIGDRGFSLNIGSASAALFSDILGSTILPEGVESRGFLVMTSNDGSPLPQVVAKTYNVDIHGGTFGQNLKVFADSDLISAGDSGFITGVSNSAEKTEGFRTNVGVLNTSETTPAVIKIHIYDTTGARVGGIGGTTGFSVPPGVLLQENVFEAAYLANTDMDGSIEIEVISGGPIAAYASVVDNQTQDPILIPATELVVLSN
jgi:hypothetical protein